jgi:tRNA G18 (ribose-2'-O)-methylase SpoU
MVPSAATMAPAPIRITDADDPRVAPFRDVRDKDLRGREGLFMAESEMVLCRLLRTPERIHSVLLTPHKHEQLAAELDVLGDDVPRYVAEMELMTAIAGFHIHRGVLAAGHRPHPRDLDLDRVLGHLPHEGPVTLLAAEGVTNVDNMGGLFRNAAGFGVDGIVLDPTCCDPLYRKAIRVSMGHVLSIPYAVSRDWPADLARLGSQWDTTIVAAETGARAQPLWSLSPADDRLTLVFGSESDGLRPETLAACDRVLEIPMTGAVPSLNVATASAVFLYELRRRPE